MTSRLPDLLAAHPGGPVSLADATIIAILRVIQLGWRAAGRAARWTQPTVWQRCRERAEYRSQRPAVGWHWAEGQQPPPL